MITCCADCERRRVDCHSKCEAYLQQRAEHKAEQDALRGIKEAQGNVYRFRRDAKRKAARRNKSKGW